MNILMMTNTFTPHVGGVARSIDAFSQTFRQQNHRVLTVAPTFEDMPDDEKDVIRVAAIQNFNGSDFSVALPIPHFLSHEVETFKPAIIHTHHPFLVGGIALRLAHQFKTPLIFTHHTLYEQYTHYVPGDSAAMKRFVISLSTHYANLCDAVITPSESLKDLIVSRGVTTPVHVIPTGVHPACFQRERNHSLRDALGIPQSALLIGHVGRLAKEKNLYFMANIIKDYLLQNIQAHFLLVGSGPMKAVLHDYFSDHKLDGRIHFSGVLSAEALTAAYSTMDVFIFTSKSETQGMVLTEAMATGTPIIGLDAPGAREVIQDEKNGRLIKTENHTAFISALHWFAQRTEKEHLALRACALTTAETFSLPRTADKALALYSALSGSGFTLNEAGYDTWHSTLGLIKAEWELIKGYAEAAVDAFSTESHDHTIR